MANPEQLNLILVEESEKENEPSWSLDEVWVRTLSVKKIQTLSQLYNVFGVHIHELWDNQPSNPLETA